MYVTGCICQMTLIVRRSWLNTVCMPQMQPQISSRCQFHSKHVSMGKLAYQPRVLRRSASLTACRVIFTPGRLLHNLFVE